MSKHNATLEWDEHNKWEPATLLCNGKVIAGVDGGTGNYRTYWFFSRYGGLERRASRQDYFGAKRAVERHFGVNLRERANERQRTPDIRDGRGYLYRLRSARVS